MTFRTEVRHECSSPAFSFSNPSAEIGAPLGQEQQRPLGAAWLSALPEGVGFVGCLSPWPPRVGLACRDHVTPPRLRLAATHGRIDPLPLGPHPGAFRSLGRPTTLRSLSIGSQGPVAASLRKAFGREGVRSGGVRSGQQGIVSVGDAGVGVGGCGSGLGSPPASLPRPMPGGNLAPSRLAINAESTCLSRRIEQHSDRVCCDGPCRNRWRLLARE
jgi:hypothetical protein